ncbi:MAG: molybdopterin molybdotransferase MoeA [Flavobacteriales bacterium]|nr:molybdopterin molybdotransferase MoeA [Flavobacteriales bacterium]
MITVEEARSILFAQARPLGAEFIPVQAAVGRYLAADAMAPDGFPLFDMSAVDGYALGTGPGPWRLTGTIAAGDALPHAIRPDQCARILTGGMVPDGCRAVVMQERVRHEDNLILHADGAIADGANIRRAFESFRAGDILLKRGHRLSAASIGLLASSGLDEVMVSMAPEVGIVRTGSEFMEPGGPSAGRIHSSNEHMLMAAVRQAGLLTDDAPFLVEDDPAALRAALQEAVEESDVVITTGGVSVGDHDHVRAVLEDLGAVIHFHGVRQKPGKPMLFATLGRTPIFGLPGNPRAVLIGWLVHVLPFIRAMQGAESPLRDMDQLPLAASVRLKGERVEFRAATVRSGKVHLLADEGSHMLQTMAQANALVNFPADARAYAAGDLVDVMHLQHV